MKLCSSSCGLAILALLTTSCAPKQSPKDFLAWSMDQHAALKSYEAKCDWKVEGGVMSGDASTREIRYQAPNLFQITSARKGGLTLTTVSDGTRLVDFSNDKRTSGMAYAAPANIYQARSMQIMLPMSCGSLLYQFFGGGKQIDSLVDFEKSQVTEAGRETLPNGDQGKVIKFYATGAYGNTTVVINEKTGMIHRISYDSEPLLEKLKGTGAPDEYNKPYDSIETYSSIQINPTLQQSSFKAEPPEGVKVKEALASSVFSDTPLPRGKPAPNFTVVDLDGKETKLSSLRGKPVLLDFWATWCGPCRASLPHTQKIAAEHGDKISVLAISNEPKDTITTFRRENKYSFPAYRDPDGLAGETYKVTSIPTFVVIDAEGNVVDYIIGFRDEEKVNRALAKVGIKP